MSNKFVWSDDEIVFAQTVKADNYPLLLKAFQAIENDNGISISEQYDVPLEWTHLLDDAEKGLNLLSEDEFETFCIGDQDEAETYKAKDNDLLDKASRLLNAFFDQWDHD